MTEDREIRNYEKLADKAKEMFETSKERSASWIDEVLEKASDQLETAGEFTKEEGKRAQQFLRRDLEATKADFEIASDKIKKAIHPSRTGAGFLDLASHLFDSLGDTFKGWAHKSEEALVYHTGEVTGPGTLTCTACGGEIHPENTSRIPPCPKCHKTTYRKSY